MGGFALVLMPGEAQAMAEGWPDGAWLVACLDENGRRWEAGRESDLPGLVGRLPVWPPLAGFEAADVRAEEEAALVRHLAALPNLAAGAAARFGALLSEPEDGPSAADISWEDDT
jgi:hypothetical protein